MSWVISILANINCINFTGVHVWRSLLIRGYWCTDAVIHSCLKNKKSFFFAFLLFCKYSKVPIISTVRWAESAVPCPTTLLRPIFGLSWTPYLPWYQTLIMDVSIAYFCYDWCKTRYFVVMHLDFYNRFFLLYVAVLDYILVYWFFIKKNNGNHDKDSISLRGDVCIYRLVCVCTFVLFSQT